MCAIAVGQKLDKGFDIIDVVSPKPYLAIKIDRFRLCWYFR